MKLLIAIVFVPIAIAWVASLVLLRMLILAVSPLTGKAKEGDDKVAEFFFPGINE